MTYDEYEAIARGLTTENAPEIVSQLLDSVKMDLAEKDAFASAVKDSEAKRAVLQDTNNKLLLRITGNAAMDEEEKETEEEKIEKMDYQEYIDYLKSNTESEEK